MRRNQHTVSKPLTFSGVGLHSGVPSNATILPAPPDTGIVFRRIDLGIEIPATVDKVVDTTYATTLSCCGAKVSTVEHFLAALYGMEIDNAVIEVDAPELPTLDGSARPVAEAIASTGAEDQTVRRKFLRVIKDEKVRCNGSMITLGPSEDLELLVVVDFPGTIIGKQWKKFVLTPEDFLREIAPARTFTFREQIEALWAAGLAKGGTIDNAIVVDGETVHNTEGLRFPDEFVRHKLLDLLGDLALLGRPVRGFFLAIRPGHTVNRFLTDRLFALASTSTPDHRADRLVDAPLQAIV